jgi:hypothetical protein
MPRYEMDLETGDGKKKKVVVDEKANLLDALDPKN